MLQATRQVTKGIVVDPMATHALVMYCGLGLGFGLFIGFRGSFSDQHNGVWVNIILAGGNVSIYKPRFSRHFVALYMVHLNSSRLCATLTETVGNADKTQIAFNPGYMPPT
jgi:hypothetical protein